MDNYELSDIRRRLLTTWAADAATHALALAEVDPSWGSAVHEIADGWLVLAGKSMYVNRAMAVGISAQLVDEDITKLRTLSRAAGVPAAIEVSSETNPSVLEQLNLAGFRHDSSDDFSALAMELKHRDPVPMSDASGLADVEVRSVSSDSELAVWQATAAEGWGHTEDLARKVADAFAAAAFGVEAGGMMVAYDRSDNSPVGCASVTIRDGLGTVGAMSTVPRFRRKGVQGVMIQKRIQHALERGCDLAATTALVGGPSERNLIRHGFSKVLTIETWQLDET